MTSRPLALAVVVIGVSCTTSGDRGGNTQSTPGGPSGGDGGEAGGCNEDRQDPTGGAGSASFSTVCKFPNCDVNHILSTGQSLALGGQGGAALSTTQPFGNLMFKSGVIPYRVDLRTFVPLVEAHEETMSSGMANLAHDFFAHDILVSVHAAGGTHYDGLKKGSAPYSYGMEQVQAALQIAATTKKTYGVRVVTTVHGERDHVYVNDHYAADLAEWQKDYDADVRAMTGQSEPIPMFESQIASWTKYGNATSTIPIQQLAAHVQNPGKVILVGPKYHLPYVEDGVHLTNEGYRRMGEYYAKVYRRVIIEGKTWEPLRPKTISRADNVITVVLHVPVPPIVIDPSRVTDPGKDVGFEIVDPSPTPAKVYTIVVSAPDTLTITLTHAPAAGSRLRYAYTGEVDANAGPTTGPRGCVRDSDETPSRNGYLLENWLVVFDEPIP